MSREIITAEDFVAACIVDHLDGPVGEQLFADVAAAFSAELELA